MVRRPVVVALLLLTAGSAAWGQGYPKSYPGTPQEQKACRGDAERFCRGIIEASEARTCLVSHRREITRGCRRVLERHGY